jgi:cytochrome c
MKKSFPFTRAFTSLAAAVFAFGIASGSDNTVCTKSAGESKVVAPAQAAPADAQKKLADESAAYCKSTAQTKATPQMIIKKVKEACVLLEKEGSKAFARFQGKNSPFIFAGTYLIVNNFDGVMLMHTMNPAMNQKNHLELKDKSGKPFFADMINLCKEKGEGWIDYYWPKPGEKEPSLKVSYAHKAKCDGQDVVVWCGIYGTTMEEVKKALAKK